ncbi:helix-turn-helix domain-containing protein [Peribacillus frigoritolerans]|uniref:helix-turn-helix domain-containing protein n=1 Tax=Peribacillus frigoritolerans TaxID=450367 RepID=UPI0021D077E6|nr:helix-turn-helix transcriptional regulator [Peribacillus frigoritolerans]MCU6603791.1 helix-turn-helix domain-containing protein [Peribacillus frigoritolerans]
MEKRKWLTDARKEKKLSQKELAVQTKLAKSYLSAIENGERTPSGYTALRLAKILDVPMEWFFEDQIEYEKPVKN